MHQFKYDNMKNGWFIGDFEPSVLRTKDSEVGVKFYKQGEINQKHYHKESTEVTLIINGQCRMNDIVLNSGDIMVIEPFEESDFEALTDCILVVYKSASVSGDKYDC